ncbi:MAG: hypothetical protein HY000_31320 [Planctomycetes bacterium]|nr:hypothetical protein [Planctomycetota bacterium]
MVEHWKERAMNAWALVALMVRMNVACNLLLVAIALLLAAIQPLMPQIAAHVLLVISGLVALWGCKLAVGSVRSLRRG